MCKWWVNHRLQGQTSNPDLHIFFYRSRNLHHENIHEIGQSLLEEVEGKVDVRFLEFMAEILQDRIPQATGSCFGHHQQHEKHLFIW